MGKIIRFAAIAGLAALLLATPAAVTAEGGAVGDPGANETVRWGNDTVVSEGASHGAALTDADRSGNVHAVWADDRFPSGSDLLYAKLTSSGEVLIEEKRITRTPTTVRSPKALVGPSGNVHVLYLQEDGNNYLLRYLKLGANGEILVEPRTIAGYPRKGTKRFPDAAPVTYERILDGVGWDGDMEVEFGPAGQIHVYLLNGMYQTGNEEGPVSVGGSYYLRLNADGEVLTSRAIVNGRLAAGVAVKQPLTGGLAVTDSGVFLATSVVDGGRYGHPSRFTTTLARYTSSANAFAVESERKIHEVKKHGGYERHDNKVADLLSTDSYLYVLTEQGVRVETHGGEFVRTIGGHYRTGIVDAFGSVYLLAGNGTYTRVNGTERVLTGGFAAGALAMSVNRYGHPSVLRVGSEGKLRYRAQYPQLSPESRQVLEEAGVVAALERENRRLRARLRNATPNVTVVVEPGERGFVVGSVAVVRTRVQGGEGGELTVSYRGVTYSPDDSGTVRIPLEAPGTHELAVSYGDHTESVDLTVRERGDGGTTAGGDGNEGGTRGGTADAETSGGGGPGFTSVVAVVAVVAGALLAKRRR